MNRVMVFLSALVILSSCGNLLIEDDPENTLVSNFDVFWEEMDRHYSYFEYKGVDWDSVRTRYRPIVQQYGSSGQLFDLMEEIIVSLEDGHVTLFSPSRVAEYNYTEGFPNNSLEYAKNYLENIKGSNSILMSGEVEGENIGYIRVSTFTGDRSAFDRIDDIMQDFSDKDGIIIDLRINGGGDDRNALKITSKFAEERRAFRRVRYRNGPSHNDFTHWITDYVTKGEDVYSGPVMLLTNRRCFSSTEGFILSMKVQPNVKLVGGITGGGSGNPIERELPNGWVFRLSTWMVSEPDGKINEGIGIFPDYEVNISEEDIVDRRDTILERAIEEINNL
ncbi:MAG: S41 family peptidase [bacterium]|nr:S41 family peptidase [bacterium]